jgi:tRNA pseudouridine38-40 synthase
VIAFDVAWSHRDEALRNAINARLPDAVALQDIRQQEGFHPRFDAVTRVYRYTVYQSPAPQPLLRHRVWWVPQPLNGQALHDGAALIPGERDFAALGKAPHGDNTVRRVLQSEWDCALAGSGLLWTYTIEANAFLQHMVRRTVSALVHMGRGWLTADVFRDALQRAELLALPLAPPQGLVLAQVTYDESRWSSTGGAAGNHEQAGNIPAGG